MAQFRVGDKIIYHKPKSSFCPGPRAKQVYPLEHGEAYHYVVDKFWKVEKVNEDGTLDLVTRTGKKNKLKASDPNISKAHLFQHLLYRKRFAELGVTEQIEVSSNSHTVCNRSRH